MDNRRAAIRFKQPFSYQFGYDFPQEDYLPPGKPSVSITIKGEFAGRERGDKRHDGYTT
jgi:hypothetical protein